MATTSLSNTGAQLGNAGTVKLSELNATNSTTRDYTTTGYYKVNPAEIAIQHAPAKAAGTPATLSDWENYYQWDAAVDGSGSNLRVTALTENSVTVAFSSPSRYSNFTAEDTGMVNQELYVRLCTGGAPYPTNCLGLDPFGGTRYDNGDGTTLSATSLNANTWYVLGVRMTWNDQNSTNAVTQYFRTGVDYHANSNPDSSLSGLVNNGAVQDTQNDGRNIVFQTEPACVSDSFGVSTGNTDPDDGCTACDDYSSSPITRYRKQAFGNGIGIFTNSGCTTYEFSYDWISDDGNTAYRLVSGIIDSSSGQVDCTSECGGGLLCLHYDMMVMVLRLKMENNTEQLINVYDVAVGDLIKTKTGYTKVTEVITNHMREGYYIIEGGLKITNDHPFVYRGEWITPEEYPGEKIYVSGNIPTVYIGTEDDGYLTYSDNDEWLVSGIYKHKKHV